MYKPQYELKEFSQVSCHINHGQSLRFTSLLVVLDVEWTHIDLRIIFDQVRRARNAPPILFSKAHKIQQYHSAITKVKAQNSPEPFFRLKLNASCEYCCNPTNAGDNSFQQLQFQVQCPLIQQPLLMWIHCLRQFYNCIMNVSPLPITHFGFITL